MSEATQQPVMLVLSGQEALDYLEKRFKDLVESKSDIKFNFEEAAVYLNVSTKTLDRYLNESDRYLTDYGKGKSRHMFKNEIDAAIKRWEF